jgi:hypothetical protein
MEVFSFSLPGVSSIQMKMDIIHISLLNIDVLYCGVRY